MTDRWHIISANDHLAYAQPVDWWFVTDGDHTIAGPLRHVAALALCAKHNAVVDAMQSVIDRTLKLLQVDEENCYCEDDGNMCLHHEILKLAMNIARRET